MSARNAKLFEPALERGQGELWQRQRLELLQPGQRQRVARRRREGLVYGLIAILIFASAFVYMAFEARIGEAGREINLLHSQIRTVENQNLNIQLQISSYRSLGRIESYAMNYLGMVFPDIREVRYLDQQFSIQVARDLMLMQPDLVEEISEMPEPAEHALFGAWAEWLNAYFSSTALALD